jgi:glutathione S-transferase
VGVFRPGRARAAAVRDLDPGRAHPERSDAARKRFDRAADAVAGALEGNEYLVGGSFGVADVMVGTALLFTTRAGIADELAPSLKDYVGRLGARPAFQRAVERTFG